MIRVEDIVEAIGKNLNKTLVLYKSIRTHPTFKVYKIYTYVLYDISKEKTKLLTLEISKNLSIEELEEVWNDCDRDFIEALINWLSSDEYRRMKDDKSE